MLLRALIASTLVFTPAAFSQISEKEAVERLEDAIDDAEDAFKDAIKEASKEGVAEIKAFGKSVTAEGFTELAAQTMFFNLADVHLDMQLAYEAALMSVAEEGADALADLANTPDDVTSLDGRYPKTFYERQGSLLGKAKVDMQKRAAKVARKFSSTLKKTAKQVEKLSNHSLQYVVRPVQPRFDVTFRQEGVIVDNFATTSGISIDLVLGWSDLDVGADARIFAAGGAGDLVTANYGYAVGEELSSSGSSGPSVDGRWVFGFGGLEGNSVISAFADDDSDFKGDGITLAFGVR